MIIAAVLIIGVGVYLMVRGTDVRLVLLGAGLAMAVMARDPLIITDTFTRAMVNSLIAPICAAMGFAMVMTATGCDRHLVHLLLRPIQSVRVLVLPGGILVAYLVNMAISSQTSTAAAIGPILVPLLLASGYGRAAAGAALLLGASFGGDLLNPGCQDVQAIAGLANLNAPELSRRIIPASIAGMLTTTIVFTLMNFRSRQNREGEAPAELDPLSSDTTRQAPRPPLIGVAGDDSSIEESFRIDPVKALIPVVPIAILLLAYAGVPWLAWLINVPDEPEAKGLANALPIVRAMLIGLGVASIVCWRDVSKLTRGFFEGMGAAYGTIISLTITAQCFGAGIEAVGLGGGLLKIAQQANALHFLAGGFPWAMSTLTGSGSGPIIVFAKTFLSQLPPDEHTSRLAALACFGGAAGRTMSPVAAVVVYTVGLVGVSPVALLRKLVPALVAGMIVAMLVSQR